MMGSDYKKGPSILVGEGAGIAKNPVDGIDFG